MCWPVRAARRSPAPRAAWRGSRSAGTARAAAPSTRRRWRGRTRSPALRVRRPGAAASPRPRRSAARRRAEAASPWRAPRGTLGLRPPSLWTCPKVNSRRNATRGEQVGRATDERLVVGDVVQHRHAQDQVVVAAGAEGRLAVGVEDESNAGGVLVSVGEDVQAGAAHLGHRDLGPHCEHMVGEGPVPGADLQHPTAAVRARRSPTSARIRLRISLRSAGCDRCGEPGS